MRERERERVCVCSVKMLPDELVSLVGHCGRIYSTPTPDSLTRIYESDWEGGGDTDGRTNTTL